MLNKDENVFDKKLTKIRTNCFPISLANGDSCDLLSDDEFYPFLKKNFKKAFPGISGCIHYDFRKKLSKRRLTQRVDLHQNYFRIHHDFVAFLDPNKKPIGWFCGESEDNQTYYMRNTDIFKKHQGNKIYSSFLSTFTSYLKDLGYERVSSHHHGDNARVLIPKLRAGFFITGMENHENWGFLVKLVKHLRTDRKSFFVKKFN